MELLTKLLKEIELLKTNREYFYNQEQFFSYLNKLEQRYNRRKSWEKMFEGEICPNSLESLIITRFSKKFTFIYHVLEANIERETEILPKIFFLLNYRLNKINFDGINQDESFLSERNEVLQTISDYSKYFQITNVRLKQINKSQLVFKF